MSNPELTFTSIHGPAERVEDAIATRHSVRHYEDRPVERSELEAVFHGALRAPSWKNAQPWRVHIVTGGVRDRLAGKLVAAAQSSEAAPDTTWPEQYPADIKRRMFQLGMQIYGVAGIDRKDKAAT